MSGPRVETPTQPADPITALEKPATLNDARDRLLQQLARAASQGLVEPRVSLPEALAGPSTLEPAEKPPKLADEEPDNPGLPQINLKAESSIDRDFLDFDLANATAGGTNGCLPLDQIDAASWGNDAPFGHQISALHQRLTGEFDEINHDSALKLARLYLFFGFGAEARATLALLPSTNVDALVTLQLAEIAEHGHAEGAGYLANQMDCTSPAALWSALSYEAIPSDLPIDTDAILREFNALPQHLRRHYGPILSRRFLNAGQADVAKKLLRILDRPDTASTPQAELAKAQADAASGQTRQADIRLEDVVKSNAEPSAEALANMINDRVARGQRVSFEEAQLAGAYAFEKQNDPIGAELSAAHIRALASAGSFDMAFETLVDRGRALRPDQIPALHSDMMRLLADNASDVTFLHHMLAQRFGAAPQLDPFAVNKAAGRLIQLGFPGSTTELIAQDPPRSSSAFRERRLLRAELALKLNRPRQAIVELLDLEGADVNGLRARALSAAGDHAAAYYLFASSPTPENARQEAWLQGDWKRAAAPGEPAYTALADLMATRETATDTKADASQAVLARNRNLIAASTAARETLSAILDANPVPVGAKANP
ncbi:hypothetical protein [Roseovarius sp. 2305UL8-3]|uniref:hypothetical protein n=1 Tax=Roseovarius conchicola TaxID=3121636 RepID=UPI0035298602